MPRIAADLGISHAMGGLVWGAAPLGIALASPFGGAAVDRYGPRAVAGIAMVAGALTCGARALATGPWTLALAMLAFGLHIGFVAPAIPKALAGHVDARSLGRANGLAVLSYTLGTAATVLAARTVIAPALGGWRPTMIAAALAMALVGTLWIALCSDRLVASRHAGLAQVLGLARDRQLLRVGAVHFLLFGGYLATLGLLPRALAERGLEPGRVGLAVASWLAAAGVANLLGPWLSDRVGRRRPFLVVGACVAALALAGVAVLPASATVPMLAIAALGGGAFAPLLFALPLEMQGIGPSRAGGALGLLMLVGQIGGFGLSFGCGAIAGAFGVPAALALLALVHLAILVPARGLRETGRAAAPDTTVAHAAAQLVA
jgi:MFS family permease